MQKCLLPQSRPLVSSRVRVEALRLLAALTVVGAGGSAKSNDRARAIGNPSAASRYEGTP